MSGFVDALHRWRELGLELEAAFCALDLVLMLGPDGVEARAAAEAAAATFERLELRPLSDRLAAALRGATPGARSEDPQAARARA